MGQTEAVVKEQNASKTAKKGGKKTKVKANVKDAVKKEEPPQNAQNAKVTHVVKIEPVPVKLKNREARKAKADSREQAANEEAHKTIEDSKDSKVQNPQADTSRGKTVTGTGNGGTKKTVKEKIEPKHEEKQGKRGSSSSKVSVDEDEGKWHCQQCTLLNDSFRGWCEVIPYAQMHYSSCPSCLSYPSPLTPPLLLF